MPVKVERALAKSARKRGLTGKRKKAYIYGTMQAEGLLKARPRKKKA